MSDVRARTGPLTGAAEAQMRAAEEAAKRQAEQAAQKLAEDTAKAVEEARGAVAPAPTTAQPGVGKDDVGVSADASIESNMAKLDGKMPLKPFADEGFANFAGFGKPAEAKVERAVPERTADAKRILSAQEWDPGEQGLSGTDANKHINQRYDELDKEFSQMMGGDPPAPNWMTFGKYATREAGEQIRNLENMEKALGGDPVAAADLVRGLATQDQITQGTLLATDVLGDNAKSRATMLALMPGLGAAATALGTTEDMMGTLSTMRESMIKGNTEIYANIAPAYETAMKAMKAGQDPVAALKDAGYDPALGQKGYDPQGFVTGAFGKYAEAKQLYDKASAMPPGAERDAMMEQRKQLMHEGNLLIGCQEQMVILQQKEIFGDPKMMNALEAIGGTMTLTDANGKRTLRPDGGSWADFKTRMGVEDVTDQNPRPEGAIPVTHYKPGTNEPGETRFYTVPKDIPKGTIAEYFTEGLDPAKAKNLQDSSPRPLDLPPPANDVERGLYDIAHDVNKVKQGVAEGDAGKIVGGGTKAVGDVGVELVEGAGLVTRKAGEAIKEDGMRRYNEGGILGTPIGAVEVTVGYSTEVAGKVVDKAGDVARWGVDKASAGAEWAADKAQRGAVAVGGAAKSAARATGEFIDYCTPNWMKFW